MILPSAILYGVSLYYKEETKQVTGQLQENACEMAIGDSFTHSFGSEELGKIAGKKYCSCVSKKMAEKQVDVVSSLGVKDMMNPQEAMKKVQALASKSGVMQVGQDSPSPPVLYKPLIWTYCPFLWKMIITIASHIVQPISLIHKLSLFLNDFTLLAVLVLCWTCLFCQ